MVGGGPWWSVAEVLVVRVVVVMLSGFAACLLSTFPDQSADHSFQPVIRPSQSSVAAERANDEDPKT